MCPIFISIQGFVTMRKSFGLVTSFFRSLFSTSMSMVDLSVQKLFPLGWVFETASCSLKHLMMQNCESAVALRKMFASYSFNTFKMSYSKSILNWETRFCEFCYIIVTCNVLKKLAISFYIFPQKPSHHNSQLWENIWFQSPSKVLFTKYYYICMCKYMS